MTDYLKYQFKDDETFIQSFDEAPLWSATFGLLLLKHLAVKPNITILDIGSGAGFPLFELAGRFGNTCKIYGVDLWKNANERAKLKLKNYGYSNVTLIEASAEKLPFENESIDLIVSNLGINNFENPEIVFAECTRVLRTRGKLVITTNTNGHWKEFYAVLYATLRDLGEENLISIFMEEEKHRGDIVTLSDLFTKSRFKICAVFEESFSMKFATGSAFLNHHFVKLGWINSWIKMLPQNKLQKIFYAVENNLNVFAQKNNGLNLSVPMLYIEGEKQN
jgi:ubiquinone/menaquinone biosynthesis C-methylase UbiE